MSSSTEQYDRIERYLEGVMLPGELNEFTQKLAADSDLASEVALHRELSETLAGERIHEFRQTLKAVDAKWKPASGGNWLHIVKSPRNLAIAAGLLLLIGFFAWMGGPNLTNAELAAGNFEQLPLQTPMNADPNGADPIRKEAHQAYIAENYDQASDKFRELSQLLPEDVNVQLYLGISRLGADETEAAITTLKPLADGNDQSVRGEAAWYLALAYLQADNGAAARQYLEQLVEREGYNWEQAQTIIKAID